MRTTRVACRSVVLAVLLTCLVGVAQATVYYTFNFAGRNGYSAVQFEIAHHDLIQAGEVVDLTAHPVVMFGQTFTTLFYGTNLRGNDAYVFWTATNGLPGADGQAYEASVEMARFSVVPTKGTPITDDTGYTWVIFRDGPGRKEFGQPGETSVIAYDDPPLVRMSAMWTETHGARITIGWQTASEVGTAGFRILRSADDQPFTVVTPSLIPGEGGSTIAAQYAWTDWDVIPGQTYKYMIEEVEDSGKTNSYGPLSAVAPQTRTRR